MSSATPPRTTFSTSAPSTSLLLHELNCADRAGRLASSSSLTVTEVDASEAPACMLELGRLREETFRRVGEGTGRTHDIDNFDVGYRQLVLWDEANHCIVGGYRLGAVDELLRRGGIEALYTRSLFAFDSRLVGSLAPAVELGRSFIHPSYQRHPATLFLLWKAIGAWLVRHPCYRHLIGPVTLSPLYSEPARALMLAWLEIHAMDSTRAGLVAPLNPLQPDVRADWQSLARALPDADALDQAVKDREGGRQGLPVLLRQYLRLGARLLSASVDPAFGGATDCLMQLDLHAMPETLRVRYMGKSGALAWAARQDRDHCAVC